MVKVITFPKSPKSINTTTELYNWLIDRYEFKYNFKYSCIYIRKKEPGDKFKECDYDYIYHQVALTNIKGVNQSSLKGLINFISRSQDIKYVIKV